MKNKMFSFFFFSCFFLINACNFAFAEGPGGKIFEGLELSDIQRSELKSIRQQLRSLRDQHEDVVSQRKDLMDLIRNYDTSDSTILSKYREVHSKQGDVMEKKIQTLLKMKKVLTKEQFQKVAERLKERKDAMRSGEGTFGSQEGGKSGDRRGFFGLRRRGM